MKQLIKKEIIHDLSEAIKILEVREAKDYEELKTLSDHGIENVALHKNLDVISITVLIYSIYKTLFCLKTEDYEFVVEHLTKARDTLKRGNLGLYNNYLKKLFSRIQHCNAAVQEHLQDVMQAARIKKGSILMQKGLSIGQAAGLMGLSNWDLQRYAGRTPAYGHTETIPAKRRMKKALSLFGV